MPRFLYGKPLILAHRCSYPGYPENTLPSLQKVIEEGADYVEVDCEYTGDFHIVVSHDSDLKRCTSNAGRIKDLTFDEVRQCDAAEYLHDPAFTAVPIPTLEEIFQTIAPTGLRAELHIKDMEVLEIEEHSGQTVPDLLVEYHLEHRCNINIDTFAPADYVREFDRFEKCQFSLNAFIDDRLPVDKQVEKLTQILLALNEYGYMGLDLHAEVINKTTCDLIHDYGLELQSYPTNDPAEMRRLMECECDVIQTDRMDLCIEVKVQLGY